MEKKFQELHSKTGSTVDAVAFFGLDKEGEPTGIFVNADTILNQDNGPIVPICHEFGHYLDVLMGMPSDSEEWKRITSEESGNMVRTNEYYEDPTECFAQMFAWYCMSDDNSLGTRNKTQCPQAWAFIDSLVNKHKAQEVRE